MNSPAPDLQSGHHLGQSHGDSAAHSRSLQYTPAQHCLGLTEKASHVRRRGSRCLLRMPYVGVREELIPYRHIGMHTCANHRPGHGRVPRGLRMRSPEPPARRIDATNNCPTYARPWHCSEGLRRRGNPPPRSPAARSEAEPPHAPTWHRPGSPRALPPPRA